MLVQVLISDQNPVFCSLSAEAAGELSASHSIGSFWREEREKEERDPLAGAQSLLRLACTHTQKYGRQIGPTHQQHFIQKTVQRGDKPFALHYSRCNREALI